MIQTLSGLKCNVTINLQKASLGYMYAWTCLEESALVSNTHQLESKKKKKRQISLLTAD